MIWASPWAWLLAVTAALPLVAHLWARRRPAAVLFPTLRFLRAASPISRRLGRVQERPLLLLRLAIVGAICAAAAGPALSFRWRQQAWRARLHRVIVVDAGVAASASGLIADLQRTAATSTVLGPAAITDVFDEAVTRADRSAARIRTEMAVVWDGSRASLTESDVADIPARVGVRLMAMEGQVALPTPPSNAAAVTGVTLAMPAVDAALEQQLRASLGMLRLPAPSVPITARWSASGPERANVGDIRQHRAIPNAAVGALEAIATDPRVREAAERSEREVRVGAGPPLPAARLVLARDPDGAPLLWGSSDGHALVLDFAAPPRSPLTWWALVSARESLAPAHLASPGRWSAADLATAGRPAPLPPPPTLPGGRDTRACWGVALALLSIEQVWRGRRTANSADQRAPTSDPLRAGKTGDAA